MHLNYYLSRCRLTGDDTVVIVSACYSFPMEMGRLFDFQPHGDVFFFKNIVSINLLLDTHSFVIFNGAPFLIVPLKFIRRSRNLNVWMIVYGEDFELLMILQQVSHLWNIS